jgi:epoxyqueuosine reductase
MTTDLIRQIIVKHLVPKDDYIYGFAFLANLISENYEDFRYGISIGKRLDHRIVDGIMGGPTVEYYHHYQQINEELTYLIINIAKDLKKEGIETICLGPTITMHELDTVYADTLTAKVSHKMIGTRAGLGWVGKSDLFISKAFGPRLRLASMLTNFPLEIDTMPIEESRCGACKICMERCPAKAIDGKLWNISVNREEFFDAFLCREKCKEFGEKILGKNAGLCGICVAVCPFGW